MGFDDFIQGGDGAADFIEKPAFKVFFAVAVLVMLLVLFVIQVSSLGVVSATLAKLKSERYVVERMSEPGMLMQPFGAVIGGTNSNTFGGLDSMQQANFLAERMEAGASVPAVAALPQPAAFIAAGVTESPYKAAKYANYKIGRIDVTDCSKELAAEVAAEPTNAYGFLEKEHMYGNGPYMRRNDYELSQTVDSL